MRKSSGVIGDSNSSFHSLCIIFFASKTTGDKNSIGSYNELIVDKFPRCRKLVLVNSSSTHLIQCPSEHPMLFLLVIYRDLNLTMAWLVLPWALQLRLRDRYSSTSSAGICHAWEALSIMCKAISGLDILHWLQQIMDIKVSSNCFHSFCSEVTLVIFSRLLKSVVLIAGRIRSTKDMTAHLIFNQCFIVITRLPSKESQGISILWWHFHLHEYCLNITCHCNKLFSKPR